MKHCRWLLTIAVMLTAATTFAVPRGQKWEQVINTNTTYNWTTAKLCVQYTSPSSKVYTGAGFWNARAGTDSFKLRAAFNETGTWNYVLLNDPGCISTADITSPLSGSISVTTDTTGNPIYALGPVRVNVGGRHLQFSGNAARFHWIGDTSWRGPHSALLGTWQTYLNDRLAKGYSVIQVAAPIGTGAITHVDGGAPFYDPAGGAGCSTGVLPRAACFPNPTFWAAWDTRIDEINAKQMYAVVIGLFKRTNESAAWPAIADSQGYARFLAARLQGNYGAVSPGFDEVPSYPAGNFTNCHINTPGSENQGCRAQQVGLAIKEAILLQTTINASPRSGTPLVTLVTHHMGGGCPGTPGNGGDGTDACVADAWMSTFHTESWLDFSLIQSGQGANCADDQKDCIAVRASKRIRRLYYTAAKPVINGEAVYDNAGFRDCAMVTPGIIYIDQRARQAAFNTLLSGGAGFTHGIGGTWDWNGYITCRTVNQGINAPSSTQIGKLRAAFSTLPWQRLVPDCQDWGTACTDIKNTEQGNNVNDHEFKRMYAADSSGHFAVAYLPVGVSDSSLKLNLDNLPGFTNAAGTTWRTNWYNPRAGCTCNATANPVAGAPTQWQFNRPSSAVDWGLIIRNSSVIPTLGVNACTLAADCP